MARGAVQHAVSLGVNRIVVGADWVAGTQPGALEGGFEDAPKALRDFDEAAQRALIAGGSGVNEHPAKDRFAGGSTSAESRSGRLGPIIQHATQCAVHRGLLQPNARDPVGSRMSAVRRSDRAGGR